MQQETRLNRQTPPGDVSTEDGSLRREVPIDQLIADLESGSVDPADFAIVFFLSPVTTH